ncbi:MAG: ATP-binding protein [Candidatus Omnitrophica bacterium]|nr:ATP-binding protein [Candidatus Omnitrophota bacterium]
MIDPEIGFTSDVIRDPNRFVGRTDLIRSCMNALNSPLGLIAVYGKRGVGKSSLLRQIQQMALGDYTLARQAGLDHEIPKNTRKYLTVYYACDSMISDGATLLTRMCNDQNEEDGLLRLVPNDGKELTEFTRSQEVHGGADLKVVSWGTKGVESSKYARVVSGDIVQTFRNFTSAIVTHQVKKLMGRDALLVLLDEFDVIPNKNGLGSLIKSLSTADLKFGISGIGHDLHDLIQDHASVERLLEQGAIHVKPMAEFETQGILNRAEQLFKGHLTFVPAVKKEIARISEGYPYFTQLLGKECVLKVNNKRTTEVSEVIFQEVLDDIKTGKSFPTLERTYQRAIGNSTDRQILLHLLAEQPEENTIFNEDVGRVFLKKVRKEAEDLSIQYVDQILPRLLNGAFGPTLVRVPERPGIYEFVNPVFRLYVRLRHF